jgi:hypothetical protein
MTRRLLVTLLGVLAVLLVPVRADAAGHTVTLSAGGPSPSAITIAAGDTVTFKAGDANTYHVRRSSGSWSFTATVTSSKPVTTAPFESAGTYSYTVTFDTLLGQSPPSNGSITVPATPPSPTPSASPSAKPRPSATASARPSTSPTPSAAPTPSGQAVPPPIVGGVVPTPDVTPTGGPAPQVAPGGPSPTALSPSPVAAVDYARPSEIVQHSAHGFGLPAALAVVAVVGVVSLIVRILLASPEARRPADPTVR